MSVYYIIQFHSSQQVYNIQVSKRTNEWIKSTVQINEVGKYHKKTVKMMKWNCNIGVLCSFWNEIGSICGNVSYKAAAFSTWHQCKME